MKKKEWSGSGDCGQWMPQLKRCDYDELRKLMKSLTANGRCWQRLGVHGTYNKRSAKRLVKFLNDHIKEHNFAVFMVRTVQMTDRIE